MALEFRYICMNRPPREAEPTKKKLKTSLIPNHRVDLYQSLDHPFPDFDTVLGIDPGFRLSLNVASVMTTIKKNRRLSITHRGFTLVRRS